MIRKVRDLGSIQRDDPVYPVWPKDPPGEIGGVLLAVRRANVPSETSKGGRSGEGDRCGHGCDGSGRKNTLVSYQPSIQQHLCEYGQIVGHGEQPGMPGNAAHAIGGRILNFALAQVALFHVGRSDAETLLFWGTEVACMPSGLKISRSQ